MRYRGEVVVGKSVESRGKVGGKRVLYTGFWVFKIFAQKFTRVLRVDLHGVLHKFSRILVDLAIDFLLDFFDLVAESEVEFEVLFDFFDTVHDGGVVFDANFGGDFIGAEL